MQPGDIYRHDRFYRDVETGELKAKYLLFLTRTAGGDWVARLLTSQAAMRPENPPCYLGDPYPGYFLGIPGTPLTLKTWVDLRGLVDIDPVEVQALVTRGMMRRVLGLARHIVIAVLECAAAAQDTTIQQERALRDELAALR